MAELVDYRSFVAVVERGSLTAAARQLGRSLQAVSRSLQMLEHELGVELVARTTRRSRPTEPGQAFYRQLKTALADLDLAREQVMQDGAGIAGRIRDGTAANAKALESAKRTVPLAQASWKYAQLAGAK